VTPPGWGAGFGLGLGCGVTGGEGGFLPRDTHQWVRDSSPFVNQIMLEEEWSIYMC